MDFSNIALFNVMRAKLGHISERQAVLAQNVANADTPNYKAHDVKAPDFKTLVGQGPGGAARKLPLAATNGQHLTGSNAPQARFGIEEREKTYELNPTGNNVVIEEEMMRIAENQAEHQKALNLYRKSVELFKIAIGRPGQGG